MNPIHEKIQSLINSNKVFLFIKGTPEAPRCGFSANTMSILSNMGVEYGSFDILTDPELRQSIKEFSKWPTFPQIYVNGQLLGGNDILTEMYHSGQLADELSKAK
jgi:monothiol glutaredoxin